MADLDDLGSPTTPSSRHSKPLIAATVILALAAAGAIWAIFLRGETEPDNAPTPGSPGQAVTASQGWDVYSAVGSAI